MFICVFLLFVKTLRWQPIFLFLHLREYRAVWLEALFDLLKIPNGLSLFLGRPYEITKPRSRNPRKERDECHNNGPKRCEF